MKLIFASNNKHKIDELKAFAGKYIEVVSLNEAGVDIDIPEPHHTLEENASEKSWTIYKLTGNNCFSEDTGLEIEALNGEPGVKSARYAGEARSFEDNIEKVLNKLSFETNKKVIDACISSGVMTDWFLFASNYLRICPPLTISEQQIKKACNIILQACDIL